MDLEPETECSICGLGLNTKFTHTLQCNHVFHYDCLMKTFQSNINSIEKADITIDDDYDLDKQEIAKQNTKNDIREHHKLLKENSTFASKMFYQETKVSFVN